MTDKPNKGHVPPKPKPAGESDSRLVIKLDSTDAMQKVKELKEMVSSIASPQLGELIAEQKRSNELLAKIEESNALIFALLNIRNRAFIERLV